MTQSVGKKILILEPKTSGHHGPYLRWILEQLAGSGFLVRVITSGAHKSYPLIASLEGEYSGRVSVLYDDDPKVIRLERKKFRDYLYWRLFRKWYQECGIGWSPDLIFLPYADYCVYSIGALGSPFGNTPWVGLGMKTDFHYHDMGVIAPRVRLSSIKKILFLRMLGEASLKSYLTTDDLLIENLAENGFGKGLIIPKFFPELTFIKTVSIDRCHNTYGISEKDKVILVYGGLNDRKGIRELLRGLIEIKCSMQIVILLAGKQAPSIWALLNEKWIDELPKNVRLVSINRVLTSEEESQVFCLSDVVWLGYQRHYGTSGVLAQAACGGIPVVACDEGIIGYKTRQLDLGCTVQTKDPNSVASELDRLFTDYEAARHFGRNGKTAFCNYAPEYSWRVLQDALAKA